MIPIDGSELLKYLRRVEFTGELFSIYKHFSIIKTNFARISSLGDRNIEWYRYDMDIKTVILKAVHNCTFSHFPRTGLSGDRFQFDDHGDGPARYDLIHFKQISHGRYRWQRIGEYHSGQLKLDVNGIYGSLDTILGGTLN